MSNISDPNEVVKFVTQAFSDIYNKIDVISNGLEELNSSISDLRDFLNKISTEITSKISKLETENDEFRKNIVEKMVNMENNVLEELKNSLSNISFEDKMFMGKIRQLFNNMKTIAWLVQISNLGKILSRIVE
ncbi:MAG: hypothetical protein ACTSYQ_04715 [Candidatus Odinarchaeia archaeon]